LSDHIFHDDEEREADVPSGEKSEESHAATVRLTIDRIESGRGKTRIAVLLDDAGTPINFPRNLLPAGARPGDILTVTFRCDPAATKQVAEQTRKVQDELKKTDPGGDIRL
jgi:hypothetical protein